jgi:hypothetical protein
LTEWPNLAGATRAIDRGGCLFQAFLPPGDAARADSVCALSPDRGVIEAAWQEAERAPDLFVHRHYRPASRFWTPMQRRKSDTSCASAPNSRLPKNIARLSWLRKKRIRTYRGRFNPRPAVRAPLLSPLKAWRVPCEQ